MDYALERRPVVRALDLLSTVSAEIGATYDALGRVKRLERDKWGPVERWIFDVVLLAWYDTGFRLMDFATYKELSWLYELRALISQTDIDAERLAPIRVLAPIDFEKFDMADALESGGIHAQREVPIIYRLRFLIGLTGRLLVETSSRVLKCATEVMKDEKDLTHLEQEAHAVFDQLSVLDDFDRAQTLGHLRDDLLFGYLGFAEHL